MPRVVNYLIAPEVPRMVGNHFVVGEDNDTLGMRAHQHHRAGGADIDAAAVMIGHDQAGGAHRLLDKAVALIFERGHQ